MSKETRVSIDTGYRPGNYFWASELGLTLASSIQGAERRRRYEQLIAEGRHDEIDGLVSKPVLDDNERRWLGSIHPAFLGGEYLPAHRAQEVEIARITIASTTQDVTCVYARQRKGRIHYRVVDEYEGMTLGDRRTRTSSRPLTLHELVEFFLRGWNLLAVLDVNFSEHGYPRSRIHRFVVDASSSFYADFGALVHCRIDEWLREMPEGSARGG